MKRTILFIVVFAFAINNQADAQFFKKLKEEITQTAEDHVINDAGNATDKAIDKSQDAAAKSVKDEDGKKNRKKSSNTARSAADPSQEQTEAKTTSAASWPIGTNTAPAQNVPDNYTLALSGTGSDWYLEYQMRMEGMETEGMEDLNMTMEMYASPGRGGRSEMNMQMPMFGEISMVVLTNFKDPLHMILLNERKKSYSVIDLTEMEKEAAEENYTVTRVGEENLHGLQCTHARATAEDGQSFDIWTTREMPGYEAIMKLYSKNQKMGSGNLWEALKEADSDGFMVKMKMSVEEGTSVMELTKIEKTTVPEAMLLVPAGYKESNGGWTKMYMGN